MDGRSGKMIKVLAALALLLSYCGCRGNPEDGFFGYRTGSSWQIVELRSGHFRYWRRSAFAPPNDAQQVEYQGDYTLSGHDLQLHHPKLESERWRYDRDRHPESFVSLNPKETCALVRFKPKDRNIPADGSPYCNPYPEGIPSK